MKHSIIYVIGIVVASLLTAGCTSTREGHVSVSPSPYQAEVDENGEATISLSFDIPANYISRRSRIVISPQVLAPDSTVVASLRPVVFDASIFGKKMVRRVMLEHYIDPYSQYAVAVDRSQPIHYDYSEKVSVPDSCESVFVEAVVSTDGCGSCTGIENVSMATIAGKPKEEPVKPLDLEWMEAEFVVREKMMEGSGTAHLQFIINKYDIVPSLGNNEAELTHMIEKLEPIVKDSLATITKITIYGMASADGSLPFNTTLSANRAKSAKRWLSERLRLSPAVQNLIKTGSRPEGWQPVLEAMTRLGHADSVKVKEILTRYAGENDDVQERHIRRLSCWPFIRENCLQKDRKVDYTYAWKVRSFTTDRELIEMYKTRPDAFNEEELLRVAQLAADDSSRMSVYRYTLSRFPDCRIAINNLAFLLQKEGRYEEARQLIER